MSRITAYVWVNRLETIVPKQDTFKDSDELSMLLLECFDRTENRKLEIMAEGLFIAKQAQPPHKEGNSPWPLWR